MTILYEVFTIEVNKEFQYQDIIPITYFNNKEEAIEYCFQGSLNGHTEFYWREIIVDQVVILC